mgnify:CR=1 FL=1
MATKPGKVVVAMSGGVDSSVAAALLVEQGYDVVGCFMRLGSPGEELPNGGSEPAGQTCAATGGCDEASSSNPKPLKLGHQGCCSVADAHDARHVAAKLGVPLYVLNFKNDFDRIIGHFVSEYNAGRTPNPCIRCNNWLKFGKLFEYALSIGASHVASGHYAQLIDSEHNPRLRRAVDGDKDQSYVLFGTPTHRLSSMMLPIGAYPKAQVREMAKQRDLPVFDKPDSYEICFVPDNDYAGLVTRRSPDEVHRGDIVDIQGRKVGEHPGHQHFTIGQRRKIGVALGHPLYVLEKNVASNQITVGGKHDLQATGVGAAEANWHIEPPRSWQRCQVAIRAHGDLLEAAVRATGDETLEVRFDQAQPGIAAGQAVVAYDGDLLMGGGWIHHVRTKGSMQADAAQQHVGAELGKSDE